MSELLRQHGWSLTLLGLGVALLAVWATPRFKPWLAKTRIGLSGRRRQASGARPATSSRDPVGAVARDAEELARHLAAQIDAKAERLERLIRKADERLAALEEAAAEGMLDVPGSVSTRDAGHGLSEARPPRAIGAGAASLARTVTLESDPVTRRVHELADTGRTPREIAQTLGEHVGKVQLILALRG